MKIFKTYLIGVLFVILPTFSFAQEVVNLPGATPISGERVGGGSPSWTINSVNNADCSNLNFSVNVNFSGLDGVGPYMQQTIVDVDGVVYMNQIGAFVNLDGDYGWGFFNDDSGGPVTGTWPLPAGQNFNATFILIDAEGVAVWENVTVFESCNSTTILSQTGSFPSAVPTMSEWGLILLVTFLMALGVYFMQSQRKRIR